MILALRTMHRMCIYQMYQIAQSLVKKKNGLSGAVENTLSCSPFSGIVCRYVIVVCYAGLSVDPAHCGLFQAKKGENCEDEN